MGKFSSGIGSGYDHDEFAYEELLATADEDLALAKIADYELSEISESLDNMMEQSEIISELKPDTRVGKIFARLLVAGPATKLSISANDIRRGTAGIESASIVGNEAFDSIKEFVKRAIDFMREQWKKFKRFIMKYWNKYFGDVERLKKGWESLKNKLEKYQDGYELKKGEKVEITKGADMLFIGDVQQDHKGLLSGVKVLTDAADKLNSEMGSDTIDVDPETVKGLIPTNISREDLVKGIEGSTAGNAKKIFGNMVSVTSSSPEKYYIGQLKGKGVKSVDLLGRVNLYVTTNVNGVDANDPVAHTASIYNNLKFEFGDTSKEQKVKEKASLAPYTVSEIESLADQNIELLGNIIAVKRNKVIEDAIESLDRQDAKLPGWRKDVPSSEDDPDGTKRTEFRNYIKLVQGMLKYNRQLKVSFPIQLSDHARKVSGVQKVVCEKSLALHKKS